MVVDGALAYAKIGSNVLAWMSSENEFEDLPLPARQAGEACNSYRT
jgi:hypothetical protein